MFVLSLPGVPLELRLSTPISSGYRWPDLLLALALIVVVLFAYRRASRTLFADVERSRARILAGLRTLCLLALLVLLLLQPELARISRTVVPSRVVVAVDLSGSMAVADVGDTTRADRVADALETRGPSFPVAPAGGAGRTVETVGFRTRVLPSSSLPLLLERLRDRAAMTRDTEGTDMGEVLRNASAGGVPLAAVVLVGDGRHNRGPSPLAAAEALARAKVPIFTVDPTPDEPPPDIAVVAVSAPQVVFAESEVPIEATIALRRQPAGTVRVVLERTSDPVDIDLQRETIVHDGTDRTRRITFRHRVGKTGSERLRVRVEPLADAAGVPARDVEPRNNARSLTVRIAPEKAKVFLIDSEPNWEFHYLYSLLQRDRAVDVVGIVLDRPRLGGIAEADLKKSGYPDAKLPDDADAIPSADVAILGDLSPDRLPPIQRERLMEFVADRGGTLIVRAGRRSMPLDWERIPPDDPFRKLLPIRLPEVRTSAKGMTFDRTPEGLETPWLRLGADAAVDAEIWANLPPMYRAIVGTPKPGATVLATASGDGDGDPPSRRPPGGSLVRQSYGFGQVIWLGIDTTWRWRMKTGDTLHHRFWGQMIRWAATDRPAIASNAVVRFGARESLVRDDRDVRIVARFSPSIRLPDDALVGVRILQPATATTPERVVRVVPLTAEAGGERRADIRGLPPGEYVGEISVPGREMQTRDAAGAPLRCRWTVSAGEDEELADLSGNRPLLEELARSTGGAYLRLDELDRLPGLLPQEAVETSTLSRVRLSDEGIVYLPLLLMLAGEWYLRRRSGLV